MIIHRSTDSPFAVYCCHNIVYVGVTPISIIAPALESIDSIHDRIDGDTHTHTHDSLSRLQLNNSELIFESPQ